MKKNYLKKFLQEVSHKEPHYVCINLSADLIRFYAMTNWKIDDEKCACVWPSLTKLCDYFLPKINIFFVSVRLN